MGPVTVTTERDSNISQMTHQTQDCDSECGRQQPSHILAEVVSADQSHRPGQTWSPAATRCGCAGFSYWVSGPNATKYIH